MFEKFGFIDKIRAAIPATFGQAAEVPLKPEI